jgi:hypothetical protein
MTPPNRSVPGTHVTDPVTDRTLPRMTSQK